MFGKLSQERMRKKIEKLEKELSDVKQENIALLGENRILQKKYEDSEKRAKTMGEHLEVSLNKYNDAMNQMREAKEEYETMISELLLLRRDYEKEMTALLASIPEKVT